MPFEIPQSWCWTTLGEIFTLQAGKNIAAKEISDRQDETCPFPCYGGNGIRGYVSSHNRNGHFPIIGRQGALCGNINVADGLFYATEHAVVVETYGNIDIVWAANALTYLNLNQYATSTAQPGLSVSTINEVMIPLPPIKEQTRIVYSLNKWFALIDTIESGKTDLRTTIKQTKSKILDLAIHGKLVPQDSNDEPASELLKRINPKAEITCDNGQYGKIPEGWCNCRLCDVLEITMGQSPQGDSINCNEGIEFHQGKLCFSDKYLQCSNIFTTAPTKIAEVNSLLLCVRAPVGVVNITQRRICIGRGLCSLKPLYGTTLYYFYLLQTLKDNFESQSTGTTFKSISGDIVKKEIIPLPPLAEQHRIVAKIEELFSKLDLIEKSLEA